MPYLYSRDGTSSRWVDLSEGIVPGPGEVLFDDHPDAGELAAAFPNNAATVARDAALDRIAALEGTVTARRYREAAIGSDGGWLKALDAQIATLRAALGGR